MIEREQKTGNDQIELLARLLLSSESFSKKSNIYPSVKLVISLLGAGVIIAGAFVAPKLTGSLVKNFSPSDADWPDWKKFNQAYLRQALRRLMRQKLVETKEISGKQIMTITDNGKKKILEYSLDNLDIAKQKHWDKKWRVIIYDIPKQKRNLQNLMRKALKKLGFLQLQESVYITPYPCFKEIEFLRQYYYLGKYIQYLLVETIENDSAYKTYFGIK